MVFLYFSFLRGVRGSMFCVIETAIIRVNLGDLTRSKAYGMVYPAILLPFGIVMVSGYRWWIYVSLLCLKISVVIFRISHACALRQSTMLFLVITTAGLGNIQLVSLGDPLCVCFSTSIYFLQQDNLFVLSVVVIGRMMFACPL